LQTLSIGRTFHRISFDLRTSTRLSTEIELLNLEIPNLAPTIGL
jgi:hypothetical protein